MPLAKFLSRDISLIRHGSYYANVNSLLFRRHSANDPLDKLSIRGRIELSKSISRLLRHVTISRSYATPALKWVVSTLPINFHSTQHQPITPYRTTLKILLLKLK